MKRILIITAVLSSAVFLTGCEDQFKDACVTELGGKIVKDTKVNNYNGLDTSGKMVNGTVTETTRFCIVDGAVVMQS